MAYDRPFEKPAQRVGAAGCSARVRTHEIAAALQRAGLGRGDTVGLLQHGSVDLLAAMV